MTPTRLRAIAGILGTSIFILSWIVAGAARDHYDAINDPISRLAELGADNRWIVTAGMFAFGCGCILFAPVLRGRATVTLTITGLAQFGVAAFPCTEGCPRTGSVTAAFHAIFAGLAYISLTATPVMDSRSPWAISVTVVSGVALALHAAGVASGLLQRVGLTTLDFWLIAVAYAVLSGRYPGSQLRYQDISA